MMVIDRACLRKAEVILATRLVVRTRAATMVLNYDISSLPAGAQGHPASGKASVT